MKYQRLISILSLFIHLLKLNYMMSTVSTTPSLQKISEIEISYSNTTPVEQRITVKSSQNMEQLLRRIWNDLGTLEIQETFIALYFNNANHCLGYRIICRGDKTGCIVDTKLIFAIALKSGASSIAIAHNHPSGNLQPSRQDVEITKKICQIAAFHDLKVFDHMILTEEGYFSFSEDGLI